MLVFRFCLIGKSNWWRCVTLLLLEKVLITRWHGVAQMVDVGEKVKEVVRVVYNVTIKVKRVFVVRIIAKRALVDVIYVTVHCRIVGGFNVAAAFQTVVATVFANAI